MYLTKDIKKLFKHISSQNCGYTQAVITKALSADNTWDVSYYSDAPKDVTYYRGEVITEISTRETILSLVHKSKLAKLDVHLRYLCQCKHPKHFEHGTVLCTTEKGEMLIDSYIDDRYAEIRPFNYDIFKNFLYRPSMVLWNKLCKSHHADKHSNTCKTTISAIIYTPQ